MTGSRDGPADNPGANAADDGARFLSLDGHADMARRRLKILAVLAERRLWKNRLAERFDASVQTIGRDVEALHADGLLETRLVSAEEVRRSLLIVALPLLVPVAVIVLFAMAVAQEADEPEQDEWGGWDRDPGPEPRDYRTFDPTDLDLDVATIDDMRRR